MRHYDRTEYRHLDDAQRYRDYEYRADDEWIGPNEHPFTPEVPRPTARPAGRPAGRRLTLAPQAHRLRRARKILGRWLDALRTLVELVR
jgi:hypothetical protein